MAFWTLYKREIGSYFQSPVAYIVLFGSALVQGLFFADLVHFVIQDNFKEQSVMQIFFQWPIFWFLLIIQVPLTTMRVFSEEFKLGTIEMLLTAPVSEWEVVLAKFFGALTFFLILWMPVALDLAFLQLFSNPRPPVYWDQIGLTILTITLSGGFFISFGVLASALTKNQIVAAVLSFASLLTMFGISLWTWFQHMDATSLDWISYVSLTEHLQNAVMGLFDSRFIVFYVSTTFFVLLVTKSILEGRRLSG
jgi:ABC-2 type transport system permease protein